MKLKRILFGLRTGQTIMQVGKCIGNFAGMWETKKGI